MERESVCLCLTMPFRVLRAFLFVCLRALAHARALPGTAARSEQQGMDWDRLEDVGETDGIAAGAGDSARPTQSVRGKASRHRASGSGGSGAGGGGKRRRAERGAGGATGRRQGAPGGGGSAAGAVRRGGGGGAAAGGGGAVGGGGRLQGRHTDSRKVATLKKQLGL